MSYSAQKEILLYNVCCLEWHSDAHSDNIDAQLKYTFSIILQIFFIEKDLLISYICTTKQGKLRACIKCFELLMTFQSVIQQFNH